MNLKERAQQLKTDIPALLLCFQDKRTPVSAKIVAGITLAYALSPIDLVPDFVPVLGYLDDVIILPLLVVVAIKLIPNDVLEDNRAKARELESTQIFKKWYFAVPVILIWLAVIVWAIRLLMRALA